MNHSECYKVFTTIADIIFMRKYAILPLFLLVFLIFASPGFAVNKKTAKPVKNAAKVIEDPAPKSYFVVNTSTGTITKEKNAEFLIPPASLTKVLTMYIVLDALERGEVNLYDYVKISTNACKADGTTMHLKPLTEVKLGDLILGMAIGSANDAAVAIAEHVSGNVDDFVIRMNKQAQKLGMKNTTFVNPNGLPGKGAFTTARDMAVLAHTYIFRFPWTLAAIHSHTSFTYNEITISSANRLLGKYPEVDGLKTGFTRASGYHIIVTAMKGSERYIIVVMGAGTHTKRNEEASLLLDEVLEAPLPLITIEPASLPDQVKQVPPGKEAEPVTQKANLSTSEGH